MATDKLYFGVNLDNSELRKDAAESRNIIKGVGDSAENEGKRIDSAYKKIGGALAALFTAQQAARLVNSIVKVRGEFEQLEVAFSTMLKSEEKGAKLMQELVVFAAQTPFQLQSAADAARQLLAYGSSLDTVVDELRMLGDVASGVGAPIGDIVYLYGTLRTQGRAYMMDIRQFAGRGIPIYDELAKVMNVNKSAIADLVSAGKVGFAEVEQAFKNMTSASGLYAGLMEKQSKTVVGRISNLKDAISVMFNEIGQSSEGLTYSVISAASKIVENYEKIGEILLTLVATYGAYRTILIAAAAVEKMNIQILRQAVVERKLAAMSMQTLSNQQAISIARTKTLTLAKKSLTASLKSVAKALTPNPYVIAAAAVGGLVYAIYKSITAKNAEEIATESLKKAQEERIKIIDEERNKVNELITELQNDNTTRRRKVEIIDELKSLYPDVFKDLDLEKVKYLDLSEAINKVNEKLDEKAYKMMNDEIQRTIKAIDGLSGAFASFNVKGTMEAMDILGLPKTEALTMSAQQIRDALEAHYNKLLEERYQYENSLKKAEERTAEESIVRNKEYWENMKKDAEAGLSALDISKKGTEEWKRYEEQILKADKALKQYSVTAKEVSSPKPSLPVRDVGVVGGVGKNIIESFITSTMIDDVAAKQMGEYSQKLRESLSEIDMKGVDVFDILTSDLWNKAFSDLDKMTVNDMIGLIDQLELYWNKLKLDPTEFEALRNQIEQITENIEQKNPFLALSEAIKGYKKGEGDVVSIARNIGGSLDQIGSMFDSVTEGLQSIGIAADEESQKLLNGISNMISGAATLAKGIATSNPAEIVAGGVQLLTSAIEVFDSKSRAAERQIKKLQEQIDVLQESYEDLAKAIEEAYSSDAANLIRQQETMLKQQRALIQQQILAEKSKKHSDNKKIKEYENAIKKIDDELAGIPEKITEAIFGTSVQSAIDQFAQAYVEAFEEGEDAAEATSKVIKNLLKSALVESLKADISPLVEDWMIYYTTAIKDGIITNFEQQILDQLEKNINKRAAKYEQGYQQFVEAPAEAPIEEATREVAKKGFATASQESIDELSGRFTALNQTASYIQISASEISESTKTLIFITQQLLVHLSNIDKNTAHLEGMRSDMKQIKTGIDDMNLKGVKLR